MFPLHFTFEQPSAIYSEEKENQKTFTGLFIDTIGDESVGLNDRRKEVILRDCLNVRGGQQQVYQSLSQNCKPLYCFKARPERFLNFTSFNTGYLF